MLFKSIVICCLAVLPATFVSAASIDSRATGIATPTGFIGFDEVPIANGALVTDEFLAFGASFTPGVTYLDRVSARPNFTNPAAVTFRNVGGSIQPIDPLSIRFTRNVVAASFAMTLSANTTRFSALLDGVLVETFDTNVVDDKAANNFYGFEGSLFNEIVIDVQSGDRTGALDTLSFEIAPVPLPAGGLLLLTGVALFGSVRLRRRTA